MSGSRVLLHAYSFEERCVAAVDHALHNLGCDHVVSVEYPDPGDPLSPMLVANRLRCEHLISAQRATHKPVKGGTADQLKLVSEVRSCLPPDARVVLDISCFTKLHILRFLHELHGKVERSLYISAEGHDAPELSVARVGHRECVGVIGYEGLHQASAPLVAVIVAGFEGDRALSSLLELDPVSAVTVIGVPWKHPNDAVKYIQRALSANAPVLSHHHVFAELAPSLAARDFASRLRDIVDRHTTFSIERSGRRPNVVVIPLGTKLQCLGLYFYWSHYPHVRVLYPIPGAYELLARGVGPAVVTELREFGEQRPLRELVRARLAAVDLDGTGRPSG